MTFRRVSLLAALSVALVAAGCNNDDLFTPQPPAYAGGAIFARYVSFGNSITAGFQSGGLSDSLQRLGYPVLLAKAMGTPFFYPSLNNPGCPPPILFIFVNPPTRVAGPACSLRGPVVPPYLNNVAFPGADVLALLNTNYTPPPPRPPTASDAYKLFLLGGRTEVQRAREVRPTFVTVWIGNNDVLPAILDTAVGGNPLVITPPDTFARRFNALMDSIDSFGTVQGGVLLGVVQVTAAPYVSQGRAYYAAQTSIPTMTVLANCLAFQPLPTGDTAFVGVPFHYGAPLVAKAAAGVPDTLDCSVPQVISVPKALYMIATVVKYDSTIQAAAAKRKWLYVDPNALLKQLAVAPGAILPFPHFPPPSGPDNASVVAPFGTAISRDGIHPSTATQKLIAQTLQQLINAFYNSAIPPIP
jgi:lysophospholipase L1-like esterase